MVQKKCIFVGMKRILLLLASLCFFAVTVLVCMTACHTDMPGQPGSDAYQQALNENVRSQKNSDKVILLVAYGSTWQQAFDAYDATVEAYKKAFPSYDVFLAFSSSICINRAAAGENAADGAEIRNYYAPSRWLTAFAQKGVRYSEIVIQSLQVTRNKAYTQVTDCIKDFATNVSGDIDKDYLSQVKLKLGVPLLSEDYSDVRALARALNALYKEQAATDVVVFMGHGNPDDCDTFGDNVRYTQLEETLHALSPQYFVGTKDMMGNFKTDVYKRIAAAGLNTGTRKLYLHPLLAVDGSIGHVDLAGDDVPEVFEGKSYTFADLLAEAGDDGDVEDCSWKKFFGAPGSGFTCDNSTLIEKGLLELPTVRELWINHTQAAIQGVPLMYETITD